MLDNALVAGINRGFYKSYFRVNSFKFFAQ